MINEQSRIASLKITCNEHYTNAFEFKNNLTQKKFHSRKIYESVELEVSNKEKEREKRLHERWIFYFITTF